jgi:hypothetical protein
MSTSGGPILNEVTPSAASKKRQSGGSSSNSVELYSDEEDQLQQVKVASYATSLQL